MKQPDFGLWFCEIKKRKIKYQVRFDENLAHDLVYLSDYLHDAEIVIKNISFSRKRLIVPMIRDNWELLSTTGNMDYTSSRLTIFPVEKFYFLFPYSYIENGVIKEEISFDKIVVDNNYYDNDQESFDIILLNRATGFKLIVNSANKEPKIRMEDQ